MQSIDTFWIRQEKDLNIGCESVFRLRNVNIIGFYYLFNCAKCFGHMAIFKYTYFPRTYSIDNGSVWPKHVAQLNK
jgi:hypothetical protein